MAKDPEELKKRQQTFRSKMEVLRSSKKELFKVFRSKLEEKKAEEIKRKLLK